MPVSSGSIPANKTDGIIKINNTGDFLKRSLNVREDLFLPVSSVVCFLRKSFYDKSVTTITIPENLCE